MWTGLAILNADDTAGKLRVKPNTSLFVPGLPQLIVMDRKGKVPASRDNSATPAALKHLDPLLKVASKD